jgi:hypothetical protein
MLKKGILMKISADRKFSYHKAKERRSERTIVLGGRYSVSYLGLERHSVQKIIFVPGTKIFKINSSFMLCFAFLHFLFYFKNMSVKLGVFCHV